MSTFICSEKTYSNIYSGLRKFNNMHYPHSQRAIERFFDFVSNEFFDANHFLPAVSSLYALNVEAYNIRYDQTESKMPTKEQLKRMLSYRPEITIYQFVKSLECLLYQSTAGKIPKESVLYGRIEDLITGVFRDIVHGAELYITAEWG